MGDSESLNAKKLYEQYTTISKERDLIGYGKNPPRFNLPNHARIAVQFVLNYEEGSEKHILNGDVGSEQFLSDIIGAESYPAIHRSMDSMYEYGSRAGVWRIFREFRKRQLPLTVFGVAVALAKNRQVVEEIKNSGFDVACHGLRWLHYQNVDKNIEALHMKQALELMEYMFGNKPMGWYTGRDSPNTRSLLSLHPEIKYDSDYYGDDLPFWVKMAKINGSKYHLIIPYTLDVNDMKFVAPNGFITAEDFYHYLKDGFDVLYQEGAEQAKMMSVGLHCRIIGHPNRFRGLQMFLDYISSFKQVWVTTRSDIALHWYQNYYPQE